MTKSVSSQPLVTVYMPTYNRVELLQRAVDSVLNQDYKNIELIVVDDNSTDGTHEYLARIVEDDSRFKYFINEKNSGACISRNKAIFAATGEFITGLDDDDYFLPNRISEFVKAWANKDKDCMVIYSNVLLKKNKKGKLIREKKIQSCNYNHLLACNWLGNQIFTKTKYLREIKGFDEDFPVWQDLECWYRLLKTYNCKAYLTPEFTYVVDQSHPHERITTKKIEFIYQAYESFSTKHYLDSRERDVLRLHLNPYVKTPPNMSSIINGLLNTPRPKNFKRTLFLMISKLKRSFSYNNISNRKN